VKGADLSTTIQKKLVASHRPVGHSIDIVGRLALAEDLHAFIVAKFAKINPRPGHSKVRWGSVSTKASKQWSISLFERVR
jgi:hypothetical protein